MLSPFAAAYVAVRPRIVGGRIEEATTANAGLYGAVAGLAAGGLVAAGLLFTNWYGVERVREDLHRGRSKPCWISSRSGRAWPLAR